MLSDVLTNADKGNIWVTMQIHPNVMAVASSKDLSGIIIVNGRKPEAEMLKKAEAEKDSDTGEPVVCLQGCGKALRTWD